ncbi:MAG: aminodeoxychorismate synthase component I [Deltaproteobacteria bacterium]|nr:aminodeoxychorismate synthase component I [Deltaproteobacteria bacterium]
MSETLKDRIRDLAGTVAGLNIEKFPLEKPFLDVASRFADLTGTVILMSGTDLDCARYHILATLPWITFTGKGNRMKIASRDRALELESDPFETLRSLLDAFHVMPEKIPGDITIPVAAGLFGYLSYDLKDFLEDLPRTSLDDLDLPRICMYAPTIILVHDRSSGDTYLCSQKLELDGVDITGRQRKKFFSISHDKPLIRGRYGKDSGYFRSSFTRKDYVKAVETIKEYIASGHVYEVNLSQRFETGFTGDPFSLFQDLYKQNPAPFFSFINAGGIKIVSTSPERFITRTGSSVETRPIKGTKPRGKTIEEDASYRNSLVNSIKDDAELSMIVDLLRNDLGKVCKGGSVRVREHRRVEAYENVYHLVSIVEGQLDPEYDSVDLIKATFPGGSITGCPKIRSMEIIDELEPVRRQIYTGSIGYISFHDTMDLSIAIRTAAILNKRILFSVGGAVVFDSDPEEEFEETLHKGKTLMNALKKGYTDQENENFVWMNGGLLASDQAKIPVTDPGFQYGYGFFETIRVSNGEPGYLTKHIERFEYTWKCLFFRDPPDITWKDVISQVINMNHLESEVSAVKIMAAKGKREKPPYDDKLIVTARKYQHRLEGKKGRGLNLVQYTEPRQTPLASHKTMNYLYYYLAGKYAESRGADEALILNPDSSVSETNSGNILLIRDKVILKPVSPHVLPGIMENVVCDILEKRGFRIVKEKIMPGDLYDADLVLMCNSLMGAVPVIKMDGTDLACASDLWVEINKIVL